MSVSARLVCLYMWSAFRPAMAAPTARKNARKREDTARTRERDGRECLLNQLERWLVSGA